VAEGQDMKGRVMSDEELRELFSAYIDGQVSAEVRAQIERRVADDADLRDELEALRDLVADLSNLPVESAPDGFTARVMEEVQDLEIPTQGSSTIGSEPSFDQPLEPLSVPLWLKGSIAASLAATLALGFFVLRAPLDHRAQGDASMALSVDAESSWSAPMGTGVQDSVDDVDGELDKFSQRDDGVAELEPVGTRRVSSRRESKVPAVAKRGAGRQRGGSEAVESSRQSKRSEQATSVLQRSDKQRRAGSGLKEVSKDRAFPAGVYEADHEEAKEADSVAEIAAEPAIEEVLAGSDGVVAVGQERLESDEVDGFGSMAPAAPSMAPMRRGGVARRSKSASSAGRASEGSPSGSSFAETAKGASSAFATQDAELEASSAVAVVSEEQGEVGADVPSIAAKVAIGTLTVASPGVISTMSSEIVSRSWSVQNLTPLPEGQGQLPVVGSQLLQITVPEGDEEAVSSLLSSYGALHLDRVLAAAHDGNARLRLTVRWGN